MEVLARAARLLILFTETVCTTPLQLPSGGRVMPKKSSISFDATSLTYNMVYMNADGEFIDSELPAAVRSGNEFLITHDFIPSQKAVA